MPQAQQQAGRIFCISMQRTGTTSVGKFFRDFGYRWAGWPADEREGWSSAWYRGDFEAIFESRTFRQCNAFEDSPWWLPDFYKVIYHRFPGSKFVLFTRDPDAWFASIVSHSGGKVIGSNRAHSKIYRRELEFFRLLDAGLVSDKDLCDVTVDPMMTLAGHEEHYKDIYRLHNREVADFFGRHAPQALHIGTLDDPEKWQRLGAFLDIEVPATYQSHLNWTTPPRVA
jgi:hypothetical protein